MLKWSWLALLVTACGQRAESPSADQCDYIQLFLGSNAPDWHVVLPAESITTWFR